MYLLCAASLTHSPSHCADAVLLLANISTIVGDVSCTLAEFGAAWVTTASDYDVLFAATMRDDWARRHRPVLSRGQTNHVMYTGYHITEPHGQVVQCHQGCGIKNRSYNVSGRMVSISCGQCGSSCLIKKVPSDTTILGNRSIVATSYPPGLVATEWSLEGSDTKATQTVTGQASTSAASERTMGLTSTNQPSISRKSPTLASALDQVQDGVPPLTGSIYPTSTSQTPMPRPRFLLPPATALSRSTSLPVPSLIADDGLLEATSSGKQCDGSPAGPPTILSQLAAPPADSSHQSLTIRVPPMSTITRSNSFPQTDEHQMRLKRRPLELSTSATPVQKKRKERG